MPFTKQSGFWPGLRRKLALSALARRWFPRWSREHQRQSLGLTAKTGRRILIVNIFEERGGASIAAKRLFTALRKAGVDVWMLTRENTSGDARVIEARRLGRQKRANPEPAPLKTDTYFTDCVGGLDMAQAVSLFEPDIVNCHWIAERFVDFPSLAGLSVPVIFTLHDQWYETGGCHYACWSHSGSGFNPCEGYQHGCPECPKILEGDKTVSKRSWDCKRGVYAALPRKVFVGVSQWSTNEAHLSGIAKGARFATIHNPIDTDLFQPRDASQRRQSLGLRPDGKYLFFGTAYNLSDGNKIKGFHLLIEALRALHASGKLGGVELLALGTPSSDNSLDFIKTHFLGVVREPEGMAAILNASNVVIVPSLMENLSNIIVESLACGAPVVAFNVGGNPELIDHCKCGYLAAPYDTDDLARGIEWVVNHPAPAELSKYSREKALNNFAETRVVKAYLELCDSMETPGA